MKWLATIIISIYALSASAQAPLKVATRVVPPFVVQEKGRLGGFSIELWKELTDRMGMKSEFLIKPTVVDLLATVKSREADVGIAAISITADRDRDFDFSQPMFDSGLQIMTRGDDGGSSFGQLWAQVVASGIFRWLAAIFVVGLIPAHVVWLVERRHPNGILKHPGYLHGIFEAYWWSLACLATQAEEMPRSILGRVVAVFWMFTAVVFVAFFTAQVTASLTVQQLQGSIRGPEDLPGKKVATTTGSTSAAYLRAKGATVLEFREIGQAYDALLDRGADAVVFDAPVLQYFTAHEGGSRFRLVGDPFKKEYYGIVFMPNSPLRKPIERALLSMKEDGSYEDLYHRWFAAQ